ncbi:hypothetical protein TIFTF001_011476 [Ficus carica]|uniref:Uncharacterized protein n=1 Tax=Ficus carica TaxID=3494 RepID=A0AA88AAH9_FICCA|nr:hypothetical protein TIFTF001_011476 [Ficus carica]
MASSTSFDTLVKPKILPSRSCTSMFIYPTTYHSIGTRVPVPCMAPKYIEKCLTKSDLKRLIVSSDWLCNKGGGFLPVPVPRGSAAIPILVRDEWGRDHPLHSKVRSPKPGKRYYEKLEIMSRGWRAGAFVTAKRLQVGDNIYLSLDRGHIRVKVRHPPLLYRFSMGMEYFLY